MKKTIVTDRDETIEVDEFMRFGDEPEFFAKKSGIVYRKKYDGKYSLFYREGGQEGKGNSPVQ